MCATPLKGTEHLADAAQLVKRYEPTPGERSALEAHFERRRRQKPLRPADLAEVLVGL